MSLPYNTKLIERAKELRQKATPQEKHLWYDFLCKYSVRFQRQKTIDHFIADFYCHAAKLVIELDGSHHFESGNREHDKARTEVLEKYGLEVIRFTNHEVDTRFQDVCRQIDEAVKKRLT